MTCLVLIGCTHGYHDQLTPPLGDILVHTGDFSSHGHSNDTIAFLKWFEAQPHAHKVLICGNHDWLAEKEPERFMALLARHALSVTYLQDAGATIAGLRFWGSPVQPRFLDWAFNRDRGAAIKQHWDLIPTGMVDVLVTHGPPTKGMLDFTPHGNVHVGDADLYDAIQRVEPRLFACSHIHAGYGHSTIPHPGGRATECYNASICTEAYKPTNAPWVVDLS